MSKQFNFRCPDDLLMLIETHAKVRGVERTAIVVEALRAYMVNPRFENATSTGHRLDRMEQQIAQLAAKVEAQEQPRGLKRLEALLQRS